MEWEILTDSYARANSVPISASKQARLSHSSANACSGNVRIRFQCINILRDAVITQDVAVFAKAGCSFSINPNPAAIRRRQNLKRGQMSGWDIYQPAFHA